MSEGEGVMLMYCPFGDIVGNICGDYTSFQWVTQRAAQEMLTLRGLLECGVCPNYVIHAEVHIWGLYDVIL